MRVAYRDEDGCNQGKMLTDDKLSHPALLSQSAQQFDITSLHYQKLTTS